MINESLKHPYFLYEQLKGNWKHPVHPRIIEIAAREVDCVWSAYINFETIRQNLILL